LVFTSIGDYNNSQRILVAGGGGGGTNNAGTDTNGGNAGYPSAPNVSNSGYGGADGGTETAGGSLNGGFGVGGENSTNIGWNGGGGGGYYGGGACKVQHGGGAGGSGYYDATYVTSQSYEWTGGGSTAMTGGRAILTILTEISSLSFVQTAFYAKYALNSTISISSSLITTNISDFYTLTHSSDNTGVATVTTAANTGTATVRGIGTTTITSSIGATPNFDAVTVTLITITVIGSGSYVTGATMTSIDLSETDLTGSVLSGCDLTSANLYGATFNAATDLRGSTLHSLKSGRINGFTSLLPPEYKMV
jgi:hypothetical protein